jgi:hypothetical protein
VLDDYSSTTELHRVDLPLRPLKPTLSISSQDYDLSFIIRLEGLLAR